MKTNYKTPAILLLLIGLLHLSCTSNDDDINEDTNTINFETAQLFSFVLSEVDAFEIEETSIKQPTMINGTPQNKGEITLKLAYTTTTAFSLLEVPFDSSEFTISPAVGEKSIIPGQTITYTITSKDSSVSLQYDVLVTIEDLDPVNEPLTISNFSFLKANNPSLDNDISANEIRSLSFLSKHQGTIVMIVPRGTDFSDLKPTIEYSGSSITYHTDINGAQDDYTPFSQETSLDFKYPNLVQLKVYNSDQSRYVEYHVIVDVKDPISFDETDIILNDGDIVSRINIFNNVTTFTHHGNYPITSSLSATKVTVISSPEEEPKDYYTTIRLQDVSDDGDDAIYSGEQGKLFVQTGFPGNFIGDFDGIGKYTIEATFEFSALGQSIPFVGAHRSVANEHEFKIYDPLKAEIQANVFVLTE
ncbi:hypothetical protein [Aquimarina pacifica]|uniref:hypothetical protein n=1 Tax=Aquimarina pacifica TaxID=1296415 RepID=UPI00046F0813|nr:hypothetical protein [Aquimarina pacifica]